MKRLLAYSAWAMALSVGLAGLAGCGGSTSQQQILTPSIASFAASPATITAGASSSLTGVFSNGAGMITPGNLAATSGTPVSVSPAMTTIYTLTVTGSSGAAVTKTVTVTVNPVAIVAPTVTVTPGASSITTAQSLAVNVTVAGPSGGATPTGTVTLTSGAYTAAAVTLGSGSATINLPAGSLATGSDTLTIAYAPDTASATIYSSASGTASVTVTGPAMITPAVTVTPSASSITSTQALTVTVAVSGGGGNPTPTGSVTLTSGSYTSAAVALSSGDATIDLPAGSLATGSDTLTVTYTPDAASSSTYSTATGVSSPVGVGNAVIAVDQSSTGPAVTDQLLGMNLAAWYDVTNSTNAPAIKDAFQAAGIKAIRWPGGSWSDAYNWETNTECGNYANTDDDFTDVVNKLVIPTGLDLALTADYGTGKNCTGPGDPTEAAAWVAESSKLGVTVSHMTVGNEEYGSWEADLHAKKNDATTYAAAVAGSSGYYALIKAASPNTLVGVDVNPGNYPSWDPIVLKNAPYDFVEYHYYPETPGQESDSFLVNSGAQGLTNTINTIKSELNTAGKQGTPIYVGEIGGPYSNPGKQSWSITQGLYAGQVLGEMMNEGVVRLTWWIGFGNCNGSSGNDSASLYGWQDFGAYNVFSDGPSDGGCPNAGPIGAMSPTARAFQLFSNVAVTGENVLTAGVTGDTTDVRAYAATNSGGTALVLFNRSETTSEPVVIALSGQTTATTVTVITYDKAIYDLSGSPTGTPPDPHGTSTWAGPNTTNVSSPTLPLTLTLTPWSMNVVLIH